MLRTYQTFFVISVAFAWCTGCSNGETSNEPTAESGQETQSEPNIDWGGVDSGEHIPCGLLVNTANGRILVPNGQRGMFLTDNPDSPWHEATFFSHGTSIKDAATDEVIWDASIIEAVQPDGDVTWMTLAERYSDGPPTFKFVGGTGKWYGITGYGRVLHGKYEPLIYKPNADDPDAPLPVWEMKWEIDLNYKAKLQSRADLLGGKDSPNVDWGNTDNGEHIPCGRLVDTPNGRVLVPNSQRGMFLGTNPDSPWFEATFFSHGTTIKDAATDEVLWDASIIEAVQADGDVTWVSIAERYVDGPATIEFIGGTGKWYGITGYGRVLHNEHEPLIYKSSADDPDAALPVWEITWEVTE